VQFILNEPQSHWFNNIHTPVKETCSDDVNAAFKAAVNHLQQLLGKPGIAWSWGEFKASHIDHLANLNGLGSGKLVAGGAGGVVDAFGETTGPSWRMVVQMGPQVKGYGLFPGGESGNPGSRYYNDMLSPWLHGRLNELLFLTSSSQPSARIQSTLTLNKK